MSNEENRAEQNDAVPNGGGCPICFENLSNEPPQVCCRQRFHASCLARWIATGHNGCPTCRAPYGVAQGPAPQLNRAVGPVLAQPGGGNIPDRPRGQELLDLGRQPPIGDQNFDNHVERARISIAGAYFQRDQGQEARIAELENVIRIEREQHSQLVVENGRLRVENRRLETELGWLEQLNDNTPQILELARQIAALVPR